MDFFETIDHEIKVFQEEVKLNFARNSNLIVAALFTFFGFYYFFEKESLFWIYFCLALTAIIFLFTKKQYRKLYFKSIINFQLSIFNVILIWEMFTIKSYFHFQEALWFLVILLSAFFLLGRIYGLFYLAETIIVYSIYLNTDFMHYIDLNNALNEKVIVVWSIEICVALFMINYIMIQYKKINDYAINRRSQVIQKISTEKVIIDKQNEEKTILLSEIHNRVKDNLQVIISLLKIQSNEIASHEAKKGFQIAMNRINAMSLVYQHTYETDNIEEKDVKEYLSKLVNGLLKTIAVHQNVNLDLSIELGKIDPTRLIPLGLIINELTTNSLKYAFLNIEEPPSIVIKIQRKKGREIALYFSDNGRWIINKKESFGLQLVAIFTEQMDGTHQREVSNEGTKYYFKLFDT